MSPRQIKDRRGSIVLETESEVEKAMMKTMGLRESEHDDSEESVASGGDDNLVVPARRGPDGEDDSEGDDEDEGAEAAT
jgi:hypothetical protein